ncbi:MAG: hypothetical protein K2R98_04115 [Gemmataceae bacterium]|nr:hypothetical protein [Gemmataceae bacterium]
MNPSGKCKGESALPPSIGPEATAEQVQPWEQIEAGRYMPRRIRGSYLGRELG